MSGDDGVTLTLAAVIELAAQGDLRCRRAISDAGREIGVAVAGLCNLINPERIVVGGLLSRAGDLLLQPIRESIVRYTVLAAAEAVDVVPATFVERAELLGARALTRSRASDATGHSRRVQPNPTKGATCTAAGRPRGRDAPGSPSATASSPPSRWASTSP